MREIKYQGLIVSDDMEMGGILTHLNMADAAVQAIASGMHVVEICRDPALVVTAYEAVLREAESSTAFARLLRRAGTHVRAFKAARLKQDVLARPPSATAVKAMKSAIERFSAQVSVQPQKRGKA